MFRTAHKTSAGTSDRRRAPCASAARGPVDDPPAGDAACLCATDAIRIRVLRTVAAIHDLLPRWQALFNGAEEAPPFLAPAWLYPFIFQGHTVGQPLAVTVWSGDCLAGLLVLDVKPVLGVRVACPLGTEVLSCLGVLADPRVPNATPWLAAACGRLRLFDCLYFKYVTDDDHATHAFCRALEAEHLWAASLARNPTSVVALPRRFDAFLEQSLSSKQRHEIRRKLHKLQTRSGVEIQSVGSAQLDRALLRRLAAIQAESWQAGVGGAVLGLDWYQSLVLQIARAGMVRVCLVAVDGEDAAFGLSIVAHGRMYYQWTAFKPRYAPLSVGIAVHCRMIEMACQEGLRRLDLGMGSLGWKERMAGESVGTQRIVLGRGLVGRAAAQLLAAGWRTPRVQHTLAQVRGQVHGAAALPRRAWRDLRRGVSGVHSNVGTSGSTAMVGKSGETTAGADSADTADCQLKCGPAMGSEPWNWALLRWLRPAVRRARDLLRRARDRSEAASQPALPPVDQDRPALALRRGDRVRVRPLTQIQVTLDARGRCHGCAFLPPMARFCGGEFRIARRVERFFDEARWRMLKCREVYLLDGVYCDGSGSRWTRGCDRMCLLFWRGEWLEAVAAPQPSGLRALPLGAEAPVATRTRSVAEVVPQVEDAGAR